MGYPIKYITPFRLVLISKIERRFIFNIVIAKANEVSTIRKSSYYIILIYDSEALRDLLLIFIFIFIYY